MKLNKHLPATLAALNVLGLIGALAVPATSFAQAWPAKPIRLVIGFAPGGGVDINARLLAPKLSEIIGQSVIVENKPGAGTNIANDIVAKLSRLQTAEPAEVTGKKRGAVTEAHQESQGASLRWALPRSLFLTALGAQQRRANARCRRPRSPSGSVSLLRCLRSTCSLALARQQATPLPFASLSI